MAKKSIIYTMLIGLSLIPLGSCRSQEKIFTIGIVNIYGWSNVLEGFRQGMTELGCIEGKDVKYIYDIYIENDIRIIDSEITKILNQDIDLLLTWTNEAALRAKKAVEGKHIPVLVASCSMPVEIGLVRSLRYPGGNVTGIQSVNSVCKGLEWLSKISPHSKRIYLPYNPAETVSVLYLDDLNKVASNLGIELVLHKVYSVEEAVAAVKDPSNDIDALYRIPSPTITLKQNELTQAAIERGIPVGSGTSFRDAVISFGSDYFEIGKQAARLANQIRQGLTPGDIPFETSEAFLTINLKIAEKIGLVIPDDILAQAKTIIR